MQACIEHCCSCFHRSGLRTRLGVVDGVDGEDQGSDKLGLLYIIGSIAISSVAGSLLGTSAEVIVNKMGIPVIFAGWFLGFISSLPELTTFFNVYSAAKKKGPIAGTADTQEVLDNLTGSNMSNVGIIMCRANLCSNYRSSKIFVMPSSQENFPIVLLEAMAAGCTVITTSGSGCEEVVGSSAITIEPESPSAIHTALVSLLNHDDQRAHESFGATARRTVPLAAHRAWI